MKQKQTYVKFLATALVLYAGVMTGAPIKERIATNKTATAISAIANEVEETYKVCPTNYFTQNEQLESALETLASTNSFAMEALGKQIQLALTKECSSTNPELAIICLKAKSNTVNRLARLSSTITNYESARSLAKFLGEIRGMIIHDYKPLMVLDNVAPPIQSKEPIMAGMDPKSIKDPNARVAYEKAIADNSAHFYMNELQTEVLPRLDSETTTIFMHYCRSISYKKPLSMSEIENLSRIAQLSQKEEQSLLRIANGPSKKD